ncbi:hypothetical protein JQ631_19560 [Bradyrhizobium manausense]|jgi:hypothetical protein|uniref:hypothetical protein n=1 Tax=Bradyrhizobium manausense TaxID=989370 RepID=UPI001BA5B55B|nr:hypothetical protein [Bradyrhizobium manausense]MBR0791280.1 hypothetical protein [Bradyrhizobium manausense]
MRKMILVAAMVLASASAHAGERSLSMSPVTEPTSAPQATTIAAPVTQTSEAVPSNQASNRPPVVSTLAPVASTAPTTATRVSTIKPAKPARTARASKPRHKPYWSERRIVAELHRYGIYW